MEDDFSPWETLDIFGEAIVKSFCSDALKLLANPLKSGTLCFMNDELVYMLAYFLSSRLKKML